MASIGLPGDSLPGTRERLLVVQAARCLVIVVTDRDAPRQRLFVRGFAERLYEEVLFPEGCNSVPFRMVLRESWLRGIRGHVQDDASCRGIPVRASVLGRRRGTELRFAKTYPQNFAFAADGTLEELRQQLERLHEVRLTAELPPARVVYVGELTGDGTSLEGEWSIPPWAAPIDGERLHWSPGSSGTWTASRVGRRAYR